MSNTIKKEEVVNKSIHSQIGKGELMGIPSEPNKHLTQLLDNIYISFGENNVNLQIQRD